MSRYAAFLRAVNLGSARKAPSAKLVSAFEEAGFEDVATFRTSGNVAFSAPGRTAKAKLVEAVEASKGKLQVALLGEAPSAAAKKRVMSLASEQDRLTVKGTELYWLPSGGTQKSALNMKAIDSAVGPNTLRTQGTIEQMAAKLL